LEIRAKLCNSLLPAFADRLGTVDPRLAKLVFHELKLREFEDTALEVLVCGLMQAIEPSFRAQNSEEGEYSSDCSMTMNLMEGKRNIKDKRRGKTMRSNLRNLHSRCFSTWRYLAINDRDWLNRI
jgi:hypothetical protein